MTKILKAFVLCLCLAAISCKTTSHEENKHEALKHEEVLQTLRAKNDTENRVKRQLGFGINNMAGLGSTFGGGFGGGFGNAFGGQMSGASMQSAGFGGLGNPSLTFADYYANFLADAAYDYYDWVCTGASCQLCDVLTGDCCDPNYDNNCFLPDSCANNPCLSGGTCISTLTVDFRPDFVCVCQAGLTGKYCQLLDEYSAPLPPIPIGGVPPPVPGGAVPPPVPGGAVPPPASGAAATNTQVATNTGNQNIQKTYQTQQTLQQPQQTYQTYQAAQPQQTFQNVQQTYQAPQQTYQAPQQTYQAPQPAYQSMQPTLQMQPTYQSAQPTYQTHQLSGTLQSEAKIKSLAATSFNGFQCNCQGNGYCAQILDQHGREENELYCICKDEKTNRVGNTYGSDCGPSAHPNPCVQSNEVTAADRSIPSSYFVECKGGLPFLRKCQQGKIWKNADKKCVGMTLHRKRMMTGANQHGVFMNGLTVN